MLARIYKLILCSFLFVGFSPAAKADAMKNFLLSCAYGTAAGAVVGLVSLAFTEDPSSKTNNVARGASIGLYVGIIYGIYSSYGEGSRPKDFEALSPVWLQPQLAKSGAIEGLQMQANVFSF